MKHSYLHEYTVSDSIAYWSNPASAGRKPAMRNFTISLDDNAPIQVDWYECTILRIVKKSTACTTRSFSHGRYLLIFLPSFESSDCIPKIFKHGCYVHEPFSIKLWFRDTLVSKKVQIEPLALEASKFQDRIFFDVEFRGRCFASSGEHHDFRFWISIGFRISDI